MAFSNRWNSCWFRSRRPTQPSDQGLARHPIDALQREEACSRAAAVIDGASAGFGRRAAALVYDAFLLAALLMIFTGGALFFTHGAAIVPATAGAWVYVYRAGLVLVIAGYYVLNWLRSGQTLGMRAWRIRAVTASGQALNWQAAVLRACFGLLAWAPAALGVLWLYLDPDHLALARSALQNTNHSPSAFLKSRPRCKGPPPPSATSRPVPDSD